MATKTSQRAFIWVIAVVLTVGTVASFVAMMIAPTNQKIDEQKQADAIAEYQKYQEELQKRYRPLDGFEAKAFDGDKVTELKAEVVKEGTGDPIKSDTQLRLNYFGWTADGKIFESTNVEGKTTPTDKISLAQVIEGWSKGLDGKLVGSTVELTIPTAQAYGPNAEAMGKPAGPLMFVVEILPKEK